MRLLTLFDMLFDTIFQSIKTIKSRDINFQRNLHSAFIVLSNILIFERELTTGKISVFLFNSLRYGAWPCHFSPMFYKADFSNDMKQLI